MKLVDLKRNTLAAWETVCKIQGRERSESSYKQTVRQYGDLRFKTTWEEAYCSLYAAMIVDENEPQYLIEVFLVSFPRELLRILLCHLIKSPKGYQSLVDGLEELAEEGWFYTDPNPDALSIIQEMLSGKKEETRRRLGESFSSV